MRLNYLAACAYRVSIVAVRHSEAVLDLDNFTFVYHLIELRYQNCFCVVIEIQKRFVVRLGNLLNRLHLLLNLYLLHNRNNFSKCILGPFPNDIHMTHYIAIQIHGLHRKSLFKDLNYITFEQWFLIFWFLRAQTLLTLCPLFIFWFRTSYTFSLYIFGLLTNLLSFICNCLPFILCFHMKFLNWRL